MSKTVINTDKAPAAIGTYSQAIKAASATALRFSKRRRCRFSRTSRRWQKRLAAR